MSLTILTDAPPSEGSVSQLKWYLAAANRILARREVVDAFGHVSQRSPANNERFFMSRSIAPASVVPDDILEFDLDANAVDFGAPASYLERFIHSEIYRARPDVHSIIHSHSPAVLPFSVVQNVALRCVCHTAGFVGQAVPVFEIRETEGERSDLLVRNAKLGKALARCLGDQQLVLMRGHGSTVVGQSLPQAVFHAVYAEMNARVQYQALQLGGVTYLTPAEAELATSTAEAVRRCWNLWVSEVVYELGKTHPVSDAG